MMAGGREGVREDFTGEETPKLGLEGSLGVLQGGVPSREQRVQRPGSKKLSHSRTGRDPE